MIFAALCTRATKYVCQNIESYCLWDMVEESTETVEQSVERLRVDEQEWGARLQRIAWMMIPRRLIIIIILTVVFQWKYYHWNCFKEEDGSWYSQDLYPVVPGFYIFGRLFGLWPPVPDDAQPIWS